jgi:glycosyltransferase involved in cell wall biosynthesis
VSVVPRRSVRTLQVIAGLDPTAGGPPASAVATALALRHEGFQNELAYVFRPDEDADEYRSALASAGISVHAFPASTMWDEGARRWGLSTEFARWFAKHVREYDVIHVHGAWTFTALWSLVAARASRRKVFLSPHASLLNLDRAKSPIWDRAIKRIGRFVFMRSFNRVIVASRLEQVDSADSAGRYTTVVPHAVLGVAEPIAARLARESVVVGFLARLHPVKNLETLIDALPHLDQRYELHVAGDGDPAYVVALHQRARELHVEHRIRWFGFLTGEQRQSFLEQVDVLAAPSAYECFCVAAVEALGAGVPVLVSPNVGVADVVKEFRCGVVVPPTAEAVAAGLIALAENFDREALTIAARRAADLFSIDAHGTLLRRVYGFGEPLQRVMATEPPSLAVEQ